MGRAFYKLLGLAYTMVGGVIAGALFKKAWKAARHEESAPEPMDENRAWKEIMAAAALRGAITALVKALLHRGSAQGVRKVTGNWPA
jgi:hypothetical protein